MINIPANEKFIIGTGIYVWEIKEGKPRMKHVGILTPEVPKKKKRLKKAQKRPNINILLPPK